MSDIRYIDRRSRKECTEKVYGKAFIEALYGSSLFSKIVSFLFLPFFSRLKLISYLYGAFQKSSLSRFKIKPFIQEFEIDTSEFLDPVESFLSFNDFFIRKLKPSCRSISTEKDVAILPADGRYLVYENIATVDGFLIKGHKFSIEEIVNNSLLAKMYTSGSMVIARLAPVDYHRFHFPANCLPEKPIPIEGPLYSVNPMALKKISIFYLKINAPLPSFRPKTLGKLLTLKLGQQTLAPSTKHSPMENRMERR